MANIDIAALTNWGDGVTFTAGNYVNERNQLITAINDNYNSLVNTYSKANVDGLLSTLKGDGWTTETLKGAYDMLTSHKTSGDHDSRYYTQTQINSPTFDFKGTWQGFSPSQVDQTINQQIGNLSKTRVNVLYPPAPLVGAKGDGVTDDTAAFDIILSYIDGLGGGVLYVPANTYVVSYIHFRTKTTIEGQGNNSILQLKSGTNADMITLKDNSVLQCGLRNIALDGNKANNTSGNGIYLQKTAYPSTSIPYANRQDLHGFLDRVFIYGFAQYGVYITNYTDVSSNVYNIRVFDMIDVDIYSNGSGGIYAVQWTDSRLERVNAYANVGHGFYLYTSCANLHIHTCKTFYNQQDGMHLDSASRITFTQCETQEEYQNGFFVTNCSHIHMTSCIADNNGQQSGWTYASSGYYVQNSQYVDIIGIATSFHSNNAEWQNWGITVDGSSYVRANLTITSQKQGTAPQFLNANSFYSVTVNGNLYGNIQTSDGGYQGGHLILGSNRLWFDNQNRIRIKWGSEPGFTNDGTLLLSALTGTATSRPTSLISVGMYYFDTTLGKPIYLKTIGASTPNNVWVDGTGRKAWTPNATYIIGDIVNTDVNQYQCTVAGTSANTNTMPSVTSGTTTDGTVTWTFVKALA